MNFLCSLRNPSIAVRAVAENFRDFDVSLVRLNFTPFQVLHFQQFGAILLGHQASNHFDFLHRKFH